VSALSRDTSREALAMLLPSSHVLSGFDFPFVEDFIFGVAVVFDVAESI
jgi:hypothetical protein